MVDLHVETNADEVAARLSRYPAAVLRGARQGIIDIADEIQARAIQNIYNEPPSPRYTRTGTLGASASQVRLDGDMYSVVGFNTPYARPHHDGFDRQTVPVRAHVRQVTMAWGRPITPRMTHVRAHMATIGPRKGVLYLKRAVDAVRPMVGPIMKDAIEKAVAEERGA